MKRLLAIGLCFASVCAISSAEIEKLAIPSDAGMCFHWWPKVTPPEGWHLEPEASVQSSINAVAPNGFTFADAETVMYAKAIYKPREPETKSLDMLIENDKKAFQDQSPTIEETPQLMTGDGQKLRSLAFFPKGKGNWERVSYGEEGDFYLIFTVSSRTKKGYLTAMKAYEQMIGHYRENK